MLRIIALFLMPFGIIAQNEPVVLSLENAIDYAFQNNIAAKNSESDVRLAQLQKWQTTSTDSKQQVYSFLGRLNYSFANRYVFT